MIGPDDRLLTVLHLSDLRFGRRTGADPVSTADPAKELAALIVGDLVRLGQGAESPDLIVVTGDLAEEGLPSELREGVRFLGLLTESLRLPRERVVLLPGDRDISREACLAYFSDCLAEEREPEPPFRPKWRLFAAAWRDFYGETPAVFSELLPWSLFPFPRLRVVVAALDSTLAESHRPDSHYGLVGDEQLRWFHDALEPFRREGWLLVAAVHHNIGGVGGASTREADRLRDVEDFRRRLGDRVHLVLHGHAPDPGLQRLSPGGAVVLGTGSPAREDGAGEGSHRYQVVQVERHRIRARQRLYAVDPGAGADRVGPDGSPELVERVALAGIPEGFAGPADVPVHPVAQDPAVGTGETAGDDGSGRKGRDGRDGRHGHDGRDDRDDDLLARLETACRLRERPGTEIRRIREGWPPVEYLRVTVPEHEGLVRVYPVGALEDGVTREGLETFLQRIDARYRAADSGLISKLVYGGASAPEDLVHEAAARRVHLQSFVEFQGLIDFRSYVDRQTLRIQHDPVYPPDLYVPQRMRSRSGAREELTADALDTILGWLASPRGRFVLVLGESGTGKSFLLRKLAQRLGESGGLVPVLVEMRKLEKGRSLDQLLSQHFTGESMDGFSPGRFRYMLEQGRIALLIDGFDELATRVTYGRALEHFAALLEAASGEAKVVVSSRREHFESESRVHTLLGEQVERLSSRRVTLLQPFSREQIRAFLVRRLGDEALAGERFDLLSQVGDLLGMAHNPRMLSFIADIPEERLRQAEAAGGGVTAAEVYRLLLNRWLGQEISRAESGEGEAPSLSFSERLEASTRIAVRLWRAEESSLHLTDLTEEVARSLAGMRRTPVDPETAAFQVGSGTLLVRDAEDAFAFVHPSILEWLVAKRAADDLAFDSAPEVLAVRLATPLMARFLVDLAGRDAVAGWARDTLLGSGGDAAKGNALLLLRHLGEEVREPVILAGRDLRGQDLTGQDLTGADLTGADLRDVRLVDARLTGARLEKARLAGADLSRALLTGADLRGADLSGARLHAADLRGARLDGARFRRAKLAGARLDEENLPGCDLEGAVLSLPDTIEAWVASCQPQNAVAWSLDGQLLATAEGSMIRLWDAGTLLEVRRLLGHEGRVLALAFGPGGVLASGSEDRTVRLWDAAAGKETKRLWGHQSWVSSLAFHPRGGTLASGSYDKTARVWDLDSGLERQRFRAGGWVLTVAFDEHGWRLAAGSSDRAVRAWDVGKGDEILLLAGHLDWVRTIAFGGEGTLLASGSEDRTVRVWDAETGRELHRLEHDDVVTSLAFGAGGDVLASGSEDRMVRLWDVATGRVRHRLLGHAAGVRGVAFSASMLASASTDRTLRVWDAATGRELRRSPKPMLAVSGLAFAGDDLLATGAHDGTVRLWDLRTGREGLRLGLSREDLRDKVWGVAVSADGRSLASASADGSVHLWSGLQTPEPALRHRLEGHGAEALCVAFHPTGEILASGSRDRTVQLWSVAAGRRLRVLDGFGSGVRSVAFSPDGGLLAAASSDPVLRLWDPRSGLEKSRLQGHESNLLSLAFLPAGRGLVAGSADHTVLVWSLANGDRGNLVQRFEGHRDKVWSVAVHPDGNLVASASQDGTVRLWDLTVGAEARRFDGHAHPVLCAAFSPDGTLLASGSADNTVRLWHLERGSCVAVLGLLSDGWAAFTPEGRYKLGGLAGGSFWHAVQLCRFDPGELDDLASLRLPDDAELLPPPPGTWRG